jgi:hypothetical protein
MLPPVYQKKSFSIMAIGGDHGMDAGIDLAIMIMAGVSIKGFHFGTREYLVIGEKIIETISGEVIHGIIILSIMVIFKETGEPGMIPTIGINQSTVSLRITMMEDCMVVGKENLEQVLKESLEQALKERLDQTKLQLPKESLEQALKERLERIKLQLAKENLGQAPKERLERIKLQLAKENLEQALKERLDQIKLQLAKENLGQALKERLDQIKLQLANDELRGRR